MDARRGPVLERELPWQCEELRSLGAEAQVGKGRAHGWLKHRRLGGGGLGSEPFAKVGRYRRVVAERFEEPFRLGSVVSGGDLDEGGADLAPDPIGLAHELVPDAALPGGGIDDERENADD